MKSNNLAKFYPCLILLVTALQNTDAGCPTKDWIQYKEEKCIRVLDSFTSQPNAELICQEQDSTLISITTAEEQEFFRQLIFSDLGSFDNVWLGAVRVNRTSFKWSDGSPWKFDNWKEGSPTDLEGNDCAQMVPQGGRKDKDNDNVALDILGFSPSGLWSDVACGRRNLVVCQRRPTFSLEELTALVFQYRQTSQDLVQELTATKTELEEANSKILQNTKGVRDLEKNPVPLGFVYTQLSGQPDPSVIWPTVGWTQVTQDYAGLFFRAEGGNSSSFGQIQNDESPRLSRVLHTERNDFVWEPQDISVPERGASASIYTGSDTWFNADWSKAYRFFLSFHNSGGEVRPKNQAIRLWKRTA